eukprot:4743588-Pyramimonas_sp.AAC.1
MSDWSVVGILAPFMAAAERFLMADLEWKGEGLIAAADSSPTPPASGARAPPVMNMFYRN